jgi:hypothetical protein
MHDRDILQSLPGATRSICPACRRVIDAEIYEEQQQVFMSKCCPPLSRIWLISRLLRAGSTTVPARRHTRK